LLQGSNRQVKLTKMSLRLRQFDENLALRWALMKHLRKMPRCDLVLMLVESLSCALPEHPDVRRITACVQTLLPVCECHGSNLQGQQQQMLHCTSPERDANLRRTPGVTVAYCAGEALARKGSRHDRARARALHLVNQPRLKRDSA